MQLEQTVQNTIDTWLTGNYDADTKNEIRQLINIKDSNTLTDAFYRSLEFGTGGLRGIMGAGSNRVNKYTIGTATQGLANYLNKKYAGTEIKVAISYDSRNNSPLFASITADVFSANGIRVYFFKELRPTPLLSFAIRELGCQSGVMLTASHNPKEYNGYKAYGPDGGQFTSPDDGLVMDEVAAIKSIDEVKYQRNEDLITLVGEEMDKEYLEAIAKLSLAREEIAHQEDLKIIFSPIHGTGITLVPRALEKFGFKNIHIVEEQSKPDGNFPTVIFPNPEEHEAMTLALNKAAETDAELVLATDPDADRVAAAVKGPDGKFMLLNGNQTASLLTYYLLNAWERNGKLDGNQYIVKTIVTTNLIEKIAEAKNVTCYNTLTGFKYIGQLITSLQGRKTFIGGGEESYGFSVGELVRDKDAVISCAFIAEMTAWFKDQGKTLFDALTDMYMEFGFFKEDLISLTKKGKEGAEEIRSMMESFRNNPPEHLGGSKVIFLKDYELGQETDVITGKTTKLDFPKSDVLQFVTEDGSIVSARPSGTEPKIKFYCSVNGSLENKESYASVNGLLDEKIKSLMGDLVKT